MNAELQRAAELEQAFLAGTEANLNQVRGRRLAGSAWTWTTRSEEERVRRMLAASGHSDRDLLRRLPKNTRRVLTGTRPYWLFWRRRSSVAIASSLSPVEAYLTDGPIPPVGVAELVEHVREIVGNSEVPHLVGVCSLSGFTEEARSCELELPNVTLVLIEPGEKGAWRVTPVSPDATGADAKLFDPETTSRKLDRVRDEITARTADLLTGGLSAEALAQRLELPRQLVAQVFEQSARDQVELKVSRQGDDVLLFRGASAGMEDSEMSISDRFRQLFSGEGDEAKKINVLSERRAKLAQRRDRIYDDLSALEKREASLLDEGRQAGSPTGKRRIASQIKQLRDDMQRLNASARVLGQQVEVISTHIHNLSLIQQGQSARLPSTEEITADAAKAEEMLEQLSADADMADTLSVGVSDLAASDEEMDILKELEGAPEDAAKEPSSPPSAERTRPDASGPASEPPAPERREPEAG